MRQKPILIIIQQLIVHNMHIIGIAENNKGKRFYIVKNSSDQGIAEDIYICQRNTSY